MKNLIFCLALFIMLMTSCTSHRNGLVKKNFTQFGIKAPEKWLEKSFRGADLFYEHHSQQATIFVNAECEKYSDSPLDVLTSQLLVGLSDIKFIKQEKKNIADREAIISEISAKVDGVERFIKTMVLRKNRCVYDAVFNSSPASAYLAADFDKLVASFWAEADL